MVKKFLKILGTLWALPVTILGTLLLPWFKVRRVRFYKGLVLTEVNNIKPKFASSITFGNLIIFNSRSLRAAGLTLDNIQYSNIFVHESRHVFQAMLFGVLYAILYPILAFSSYLVTGDFFSSNFFEVDARIYAEKIRTRNP